MDPAKLKVVELRAELQQRGLDAKGNKPVLVERLRKALEQENSTRDQDKTSVNAEVIHDSVIKENDDKPAESAKPPQTPKTSGRASRSSTMTTPTKVSTRNAPRTCTTPNSVKQPSPMKVQPAEASVEVLPTITECTAQEQTQAKEESIERSPSKGADKQGTDIPEGAHNETCSPEPTKVETESKNVEKIEESEASPNVIQSSATESPKEPNKSLDRSLELTEASPVKDTKQDPQSLPSSKKEVAAEEKEEAIAPEVHDDDLKEETIDEKDEEPTKEDDSQEAEETVKLEDANNADKLNDSNAEELEPTQKEDKDNNVEDTAMTTDSELLEDNIKPIETEEAKADIADKENSQDVEMVEAKQEEATKSETQEEQHKNECIDRKRKRSPSPAEDHEMSPAPIQEENEPEIDDSALVLSWYDSDLNLVIEKDGFFTATPLHNDGFSHMWAGARASYGFLNGKVYYEAKITEQCPIDVQGEHPFALRIGWSALDTSMQLGEEKQSYGYDSSGKKSTNNEFVDYGPEFSKDDVIGCYLDATSDDSITLSYTVNGNDVGAAFTISKQELDNKPLFPHILSKNCTFKCNFGQENPWSEKILDDYVSIGNVGSEYKVPGPRRPEKKEDCEVIMVCGLPGCGKTVWASKHAAEHPLKRYNILGISSMIDKMKNMGLPCKENYTGSWDALIQNCTRALDTLLEIAPTRRRNYILDQTNVYPSAQRRKMKNFSGYQRKAVVIVPTEEEFKLRVAKHKPIEGTDTSNSALMEMKANFSAPLVGDSFDAVEWIELGEEEGKKLIEKYNKEGKDAGFSQQQANKRPRLDKADTGNKESRDTRNNRDGRDHRRNNYPERNRNPAWRGGSHMGWRDRPQRGGPLRHGGGYGPPPMVPWRGRGVPMPPHRGLDRRGGMGDRRGGDRGRSGGSRQGGWGPVSNYQGAQQGAWGQQGNWSGGQPGSWGQGGWGGQQWGSWKSYGQGSYSQTNYNQQGYGNGNWNSWGQQYYNQYWDQPQQTGQTTAAGGQATNTTESVTAASSSDSAARYSYPQEWQEDTEEYFSSEQSAAANAQRFQRHG